MLVTATLQFVGCAVEPKYKTPATPVAPAYKEKANWKVAQPSENNLGGNWWEISNDPQLNALEEQIDVSNQNLKMAFAQYQVARAALRSAGADYYPSLTAGPTATRHRYSSNRPANLAGGLTFNHFLFPVYLNYQRRNPHGKPHYTPTTWSGKPAPSEFLHKQLDVTHINAGLWRPFLRDKIPPLFKPLRVDAAF